MYLFSKYLLNTFYVYVVERKQIFLLMKFKILLTLIFEIYIIFTYFLSPAPHLKTILSWYRDWWQARCGLQAVVCQPCSRENLVLQSGLLVHATDS